MSSSWFVAFADGDERSFPGTTSTISGKESSVYYESGERWILTQSTHCQLIFAESGMRRLAVIGETSFTAGRLSQILSRYNDANSVMNAAHASAGSFHILYTDGYITHVQGTASGVREVFYAGTSTGNQVVSNSVEQLARLTQACPRVSAVAWGLLHPGFDYGLKDTTYWSGIRKLPAEQRLAFGQHHLEYRTWWQPPVSELSLAAGATQVRQALDDAVQIRVRAGKQISADLSGGMDSTSLCILLTEQSAQYHAFVEQTIDPNHDDAKWAEHAAYALEQPLSVLRPGELPEPYDGIVDDTGELDFSTPYGLGTPYTLIRNRARKIALSARLRETGSSLHIAGFGGDELFTTAPSYFSDVYGRNPFKAVRGIRTLSSLRRWSTPSVLRALSRQQSYQEWFDEQLEFLEHEGNSLPKPTVGWGPQLRLPRWVTAKAADMIREEAKLAGPVQPQGGDRATHTALAGQRIGGERLAPLRELMGNAGISLSLPYMDDAVLGAALSVSREESLPGVAYKPILKAAMRSSRAEAVLSRSTKGEFSMSVQRGMSKNRSSLLKLFESSALVEQGLVDADKLRAAIQDGMRPQHDTAALELTLAAEVWTRNAQEHFQENRSKNVVQERKVGNS